MSPPTTPTRATKRKEADTVKKSRFFEAYDSRMRAKGPIPSLESVAIKHGISKSTA
jgi:hypothetical protein